MNLPPISRRFFVKQGALAFAAIGAGALFGPAYLRASVLAAESRRSAGGRRVLVCVFQRGAADGLSMVAPFGDPDYYRLRSDIALAAPTRKAGATGVLDLGGGFGLHPALGSLHEFYGAGELAVVHACGNPLATRSHFEAQDMMELGTDRNKNLPSGWLNRLITACPEDAVQRTALSAVALTSQLPRSLYGPEEAIAIADIARFGVAGGSPESRSAVENSRMGGGTRSSAATSFAEIYENAVGDALHGAGQDGFAAIDLLRNVKPGNYRPAEGAKYPNGNFGRSMRQVAQLIKAGVGLEIAFVEIGGWDTHANQGNATGALATRLTEFGQGLAALHRDLGAKMSDVLILTMSEFGRTARQNGNRGTDHGHGTAFFALGGPVKGGKVLGSWPGLAPDKLYEGRDLAITTDYRNFFAEACVRHMGVETGALANVFPQFSAQPENFSGYLRR